MSKSAKTTIDLEDFKKCIIGLEDVFSKQKDRLGELDSVVGDGDHGESMARGFSAVSENLKGEDFSDYNELLNKVANILIRSIGGAAGPIFGSLFLGMAEEAAKTSDLGLRDFAECLKGGLRKVKERGGAKPGDKTMVDALDPAVKKLDEKASQDEDICSALHDSYEEAERGMKETTQMIGRKGRSSFSGGRSKGYQDPGATSITLIFEHFYGFLCD